MEYWVNYESIRLLDFQDKKLVRWEVSACQCRRCGFHPWSGKIPHSTKPMHHDYWACALKPLQERIPQWEVHAFQLDGRRPSPPPLAATREKPEDSAQLERKKKKKKKKKDFKICYKTSTNKTLKKENGGSDPDFFTPESLQGCLPLSSLSLKVGNSRLTLLYSEWARHLFLFLTFWRSYNPAFHFFFSKQDQATDL